MPNHYPFSIFIDSMQLINAVAIQGSLLKGTPTDEAQLCVNRLVWGGLNVHIIQEQPAEQLPLLENVAYTDDLSALQHSIQGQLLFLSDASHNDLTSPGVIGWRVQLSHQPAPSELKGCVVLPSLSQVPREVALYQQRAAGQAGKQVAVVAYTMAAKREKELAALSPNSTSTDDEKPSYQGGLLCLIPQEQLVFMPLDIYQPLDQQLPFQAVLHKASDELEEGPSGRPHYSPRIQHLQQWLQAHPDIQVVDPLDCTSKVIDRLDLTRVVSHLRLPDNLISTAQFKVSAGSPRNVIIHNLEDMHQLIQQADLQPPFIVKPAVACGLPGSHRMLLVLATGLLPTAVQSSQLQAPLVVQEFRNHGGNVAKVYVAGEQVFHTLRPSIPDLPRGWAQAWSAWDAAHGLEVDTQPPHLDLPLQTSSQTAGLAEQGWLVFDSLKSLPTQQWLPGDAPSSSVAASVWHELQPVLVSMAAQLRRLLGLSLFGFDVIAIPTLDTHSAALQVIDVNYLPNYRVPGAASLVWHVIRDKVAGKSVV